MRRGDVSELSGSVGLGAWTGFGVLTMVVVGGDGASLFLDDRLHSWSISHRPEVAVAVARALTATGTGVIPYVLAALAGVLVGRTARHRLIGAALGVACLASGQLLRYGVMALVHRPRPPQHDWQTHASGWSFPSGHSTTATLTAGLLIVALSAAAPRAGTPLRVVVGCWGALVGLTRVYLGVHWFTDVLAGWLFALGWLGVWLCAAARWLPGRFIRGTAFGSGPDMVSGSASGAGAASRADTEPGPHNPRTGPAADSRTRPGPGSRSGSRPAPRC